MEKLLLIDGHSILSRAFFGIPHLSSGDGTPTNAVYGFMNILLKTLADEKPDYVSVAFDLDRRDLKRTKLYPEYKGTRKPMPDELHVQVPLMQRLLASMKIPVITLSGYEADDILGTLAMRGAKEGMEVTVLSGDRDLLQLARENVKILIPKTVKGTTESFSYFPEDVKNEYHVTPSEFIDLKALMGDTSDNIPGLPGVGEITASGIIQKYHSIENAYEHMEEIKPQRAQNAFRDHFELARLSRKLAEIELDVPVNTDIRSGNVKEIYTADALKILRELELKSLAAKFGSNLTEEVPQDRENLPEFKTVTDRFRASVVFDDISSEQNFGFSFLSETRISEPVQLELFSNNTKTEEEIITAAFSLPENRCYVISSGPDYPAGQLENDLSDLFRKLVGKDPVCCCFGLKHLMKRFPDLSCVKVFDTAIAAYLLNPLRESYTYDTVAIDHLGLLLESRKERAAKKQENDCYPVCAESYTALKSYEVCKRKLKEQGMWPLFTEVELPLAVHLSEMESAGIRADRNALKGYSEDLRKQIRTVEEEIYRLCGEEFNLNSPIQLGTVLFDKLALKGGKKTKKGYSTSADVLEKLTEEHPVIPLILRYRKLTKLNSTYADGLPAYICEDGRIYGKFHQTVTATGRISSADPNLQNIPVRTEEGREIRKVFIPADGYTFLDADYSQVELRILASLSGDENLIRAYRNSEDIHTATASKVFHVSPEEVTPEMRRNAKAVNFGIVYGISAFGLGEDLSVSRKEASEYIKTYFETYPGVKQYLDRQVKAAKEQGFVKTSFGRIRPVPELKSSSFMERSFGERIAMNSPIQGTAADVMKIAMNRVADRLKGMKSRIVLQVHDELLIETAPEEAEKVRSILKKEMEGAADFPVPLVAEVKEGKDWNECH